MEFSQCNYRVFRLTPKGADEVSAADAANILSRGIKCNLVIVGNSKSKTLELVQGARRKEDRQHVVLDREEAIGLRQLLERLD